MKFLNFGLILILSHTVKAQTLLVPASDLAFEKYKEYCVKPGYICTMNSFYEQLQNQPTPLFDLLLNDLDYSSEKFSNELASRILIILKKEMISIEQVEILSKITSQVKDSMTPQKSKQLLAIEKQLNENIDLIKQENLIDFPESFSIVHKKAVSKKFEKKLNTDFFKTKSEHIHFNRALSSSEFLTTSDCGQEILHPSVQNEKWQVLREKACHFSEQFARASTHTVDFITENKNTLITVGLIAIGAAVLMNNYEVQFSF